MKDCIPPAKNSPNPPDKTGRKKETQGKKLWVFFAFYRWKDIDSGISNQIADERTDVRKAVGIFLPILENIRHLQKEDRDWGGLSMAAFYEARASGRLFNLLRKEDAGG